MRILIRDQRSGHSAYHPIENDELIAIETGGSISDPDIDSIELFPSAVILNDDAGHASNSPDADARSWLQSWSQSGWDEFNRAFRKAQDILKTKGTQLVIRPSSSGMLSDAVCTLNWCTRGGGQDAMVLLDPMGWIVPSMMRDLEDHLDRIVELCQEMVAHRRVWGIIVRSISRNVDRGGTESCPLGSGDADGAMILSKLRPLIDACERTIVTDPSDIPRIQPGASIES